MKLAGRCVCGVLSSLVEKDPPAHLRCSGEERCSRCRQVKPIALFKKLYRHRGGHCKRCAQDVDNARRRRLYATDHEYRTRTLSQHRAMYWEHKMERLEKAAEYRRKNGPRERARRRRYYRENRERVLAQQAGYRLNHKEQVARRHELYWSKNSEAIKQRARDRRAARRLQKAA